MFAVLHNNEDNESAMLQVRAALGILPTMMPPTLANSEDEGYITIQGVQHSTLLTTLNLRYKQLQNEDIAPLRYMVNLISLNLSYNEISDITPIMRLENLASG